MSAEVHKVYRWMPCMSFIDRSFNVERILNVVLSYMEDQSPN